MKIRANSVLFVFCLWPILNFIKQNKEQLGKGEYLVLLSFFAIAFFVCVVIYRLLQLVFGQSKQPSTVAAIVALLIIFFNYPVIFQFIDEVVFSFHSNYFYLFALLTIPVAAFLTCKNKVAIDALLVAGLAAIVLPTMTLSYYFLTKTHFGLAQANHSGDATKLKRSPNIYYIMTDSYARQDQLLKLFNYDNTPFLGYLKEHGFYIADHAYSNYPETFISLPSSLWMDYPVTEESLKFSDRQAFYSIIQGNNPVVTYIKSHGYSYVHMGVGRWAGSKCGGNEDLCLANNDELKLVFYSMTPIAYFRRNYSLTTAASLEKNLDAVTRYQSFFLFAHLQPPHPPATFDKNCRPTLVKPNTLIWQNSGKAKAEYLNDLRCTNQQLIPVIDKILSRDPQAIIILHSDHGTGFGVNWEWSLNQWPREAFEERFSILMALRLPAECRQTLYPSLSPVNIFRVTFACIEGRSPETLPDVSYISTYEGAKEFGRVHKYDRLSSAKSQNLAQQTLTNRFT